MWLATKIQLTAKYFLKEDELVTRISAGVDVSKNRSTVCIMDQDGKVIMRPFLVWHSTEELDFLADTLKRLNGEVRVIMESTSI